MYSSPNFPRRCCDLGGEGPRVSGRIEGKKKGKNLRNISQNDWESGDSVSYWFTVIFSYVALNFTISEMGAILSLYITEFC